GRGDPGELHLPAVKRQAARFRIFAYNQGGDCLGEVTAGSVQSIEWTVELANKKASAAKIGQHRDHGKTNDAPRLRNRDIRLPERWRLEITPRARRLKGANQRAVFDDGTFMGVPVELGEIRIEADGRLLVLGGYGKAGTYDATKRIRGFTDNDGWYDDLADGPVTARITLRDGRVVDASSAWVVVLPPDFTPGLQNVAT